MENKINIAELLKDCPQGMELDCTMFENVTFVRVYRGRQFPIEIAVGGTLSKYLTKEGCFHDTTLLPESKCVIFPKGKTTWEGFQRPFKDGDIVATGSGVQVFIFQRARSNTSGYCYIGYDFKLNKFFDASVWKFERLATEEEKQKLFDAIKANGYRWNAETKTLEKLIEPKFKVGDRVRHCRVEGSSIYRVVKIEKSKYVVHKNIGEYDYHIDFEVQDDWELVSNKFDITTLKPFESRVLVRDFNDEEWCPAIWGVYGYGKEYPHIVVSGNEFIQCIPYKGNEHLLGTTNNCDEYYKTWE